MENQTFTLKSYNYVEFSELTMMTMEHEIVVWSKDTVL